ncbi:MAG: DUF1127 domain-containing protein [Acidiferrobacterales bacterium]
MNYATAAYVTTLVPQTGPRPVSATDSVFDTWRKRRTAIRELRALDDHTLKDIGLSRSQIPSVVEGLLAQSRTAG